LKASGWRGLWKLNLVVFWKMLSTSSLAKGDLKGDAGGVMLRAISELGGMGPELSKAEEGPRRGLSLGSSRYVVGSSAALRLRRCLTSRKPTNPATRTTPAMTPPTMPPIVPPETPLLVDCVCGWATAATGAAAGVGVCAAGCAGAAAAVVGEATDVGVGVDVELGGLAVGAGLEVAAGELAGDVAEVLGTLTVKREARLESEGSPPTGCTGEPGGLGRFAPA
jgi:hypothetical protein